MLVDFVYGLALSSRPIFLIFVRLYSKALFRDAG